MNVIDIKGAKTHNLKNINLTLPKNKFIVFTGLSGSGKSSLAFSTIYAEGQRRYVESLSSYARQFLSIMDKPEVDSIQGLSPAISIEQKSTSHNPRSTVGTVTEIYDYLRLLYARVGVVRCPKHSIELNVITTDNIVDNIMHLSKEINFMLIAPLVIDKKGEHRDVLSKLESQGFVRVRIDNVIYDIDDLPQLEKNYKHSIEVVIDRFKILDNDEFRSRLSSSVESALKLSSGLIHILPYDAKNNDQLLVFSTLLSCPYCGYSVSELEPKFFSFNSPDGACFDCDGIGKIEFFNVDLLIKKHLSIEEGAIIGWEKRNAYYYRQLQVLSDFYKFDLKTSFGNLPKKIQNIITNGSGKQKFDFTLLDDFGRVINSYKPFEGVLVNLNRRFKTTVSTSYKDKLSKFLSYKTCQTCNGDRLNQKASSVFVGSLNLPKLSDLTISDSLRYFENLNIEGFKRDIADKVVNEIIKRLSFLNNVGLNYLTINRSANTLSGGEAQRIRLASQIGSGLTGVLYILDEPSIGLHQRDNSKLLDTLKYLRDLGNTVIVVEHDEDAILSCDFLVDIGPLAGVHGGQIVSSGALNDVLKNQDSLTVQYLLGKKKIDIPKKRITKHSEFIEIFGASGNNLKSVDISIPLSCFVCITGVSGSGKSTLINHTLYPLAASALNGATTLEASEYTDIKGLQYLDKVIAIDQSPIGRTPRSNPATYTGIWTPVRDLFASVNDAKVKGFKQGRFSFNIAGGRCSKCEGDGVITVEMHFLPNVYVVCDECKGKRYNQETLSVKYKGKNIHDVLEMTIEEARRFFDAISTISNKLQSLIDVGLSYLKLGQSSTTLSGGEAQRVKLASELAKRDTGKTLYILDEPTTGLHFEDINNLLTVLFKLRDKGNSIVVIEHNLDVIKTADYIIDIGPEGGDGGGQIVAQGTPETIVKNFKSFTGKFLKPLLKKK